MTLIPDENRNRWQTARVADGDIDRLLRMHAFDFVSRLLLRLGDPLPWQPLADGFEFRGRRVTLLGARGIWKPAAMSLPLSIRTSHRDPYGDEARDDGFLHYRYFGTDVDHIDNVGLRKCMDQARPLIYFRGHEPGWYSPLWPMLLLRDDPASLTFVGACDDVERLSPGVDASTADVARRQYVTRAALVRLHQAGFRRRVLTAYRESCTVCRLHHPELLDAAHILPDRHEQGDPVVSNGLAMCKIHHAAFDANIMGIRPDHVVEVRADILAEVDGPMLRHGLQQLHGERIVLPRQRSDAPDAERLETRYEQFRSAS